MVMRELLARGGLLLHDDVSPLGRVGPRVQVGARRGRGLAARPRHAAQRAHARAGAREARLVLRRRRTHLLLLRAQHLLLLLLKHLGLLLARYAGCGYA